MSTYVVDLKPVALPTPSQTVGDGVAAHGFPADAASGFADGKIEMSDEEALSRWSLRFP
jgi:hypothetical protein